MVYILVRMHMALHVLFGTFAMVYISIEMCMALIMAYIPFETHSAPAMVNTFVKMHFAHNNILNISFETQTKIHCVFPNNEKSISAI
jgi:hypothetical protein